MFEDRENVLGFRYQSYGCKHGDEDNEMRMATHLCVSQVFFLVYLL